MKTILIQLDTDPLPSSFDRVVAVDSGVEELFAYGAATPQNITSIVHGAIFTRSPNDLHRTAIFIGGSDVSAGEQLLTAVQNTFFGPLRVSVMCDPNGANTTAAAAVHCAVRHVDPREAKVLILGGTGPVGSRAGRLLAQLGASVTIASRSLEKAEQVCGTIRQILPESKISACETGRLSESLSQAQILIAAGAAGVCFLKENDWTSLPHLQVAIDLNAVPPLGIEGVDVSDKADSKHGITTYGAIGVGGFKMKIHRQAIRQLFESNDRVIDIEETYAIAQTLS